MDLFFILQDLKLKFYQLMIEVARHEGSYLDICKYYRAMFDTPSVLEDKNKKHEVLRNAVLFLILAPYDNEQSDLIHRVSEEKTLDEIPLYRDLLKCFTTAELMRWSHIKEVYESELRTGSSATGVFEQGTDEGKKRWEDLRKRVVEHVSVIFNFSYLFRVLFLLLCMSKWLSRLLGIQS